MGKFKNKVAMLVTEEQFNELIPKMIDLGLKTDSRSEYPQHESADKHFIANYWFGTDGAIFVVNAGNIKYMKGFLILPKYNPELFLFSCSQKEETKVDGGIKAGGAINTKHPMCKCEAPPIVFGGVFEPSFFDQCAIEVDPQDLEKYIRNDKKGNAKQARVKEAALHEANSEKQHWEYVRACYLDSSGKKSDVISEIDNNIKSAKKKIVDLIEKALYPF